MLPSTETVANVTNLGDTSTIGSSIKVAGATAAGVGVYSIPVVTYACAEPFTLSPWPNITCVPGAGGPSCRGPQCEPLTSPSGGAVHVSSTYFPANATYECNVPEALSGTAVRECLLNGTWTRAAPHCAEFECPAPNIPNGTVQTTSAFYPSSGQVSCDEGHGLQGNTSIACDLNGAWGDLPTCVECMAGTFAPAPTAPCVQCAACPTGKLRRDCGRSNEGTCEYCPEG